MSSSLFTPHNVMFILGILGVLFTVYNYFRNPQISADKKDALLAQQVQWSSEATDRRFKDIQESFQGLLLQSNNHIHTVESKVDKCMDGLGAVGIEIAKLGTIIEERIPKK